MGRVRGGSRSRLLTVLAVGIAVVTVGAASAAVALPEEGSGDADLSGVVYDDTNLAPVDGVTVCLWDADGGICDTTGVAGDYSFNDVAQGTYALRVTPPSGTAYLPIGGYPGTYVALPEIPVTLAGSGAHTENLPLYLGGRIAVTLTLPDGTTPADNRPLVICRTDDGGPGSCPELVPVSDTDGAGMATTDVLFPGVYRVTAGYSNDPAGYPATATGVFVDPNDTNEIDLRLVAGGSLDGYVRDTANQPVQGATVSIAIPPNVGIEQTTTNASGYYSFASLEPGTYAGTVYPPPGGAFGTTATGSIVITENGTTHTDLVLPTPTVIAGSAATDGSFSSVIGAVLVCGGTATPLVTSPPTCSNASPAAFVTLPVSASPVPFSYQPPAGGTYTIRLGYYNGTFPSFVAAGSSPPVTLTVGAGQTVSCTLVAGTPGSGSCGGPPPPPPGTVVLTVNEPVVAPGYYPGFCAAPGDPLLLNTNCSDGRPAVIEFGVAGGSTRTVELAPGTYNAAMGNPALTFISPIGSLTVVSGATTYCTFTLSAVPSCAADDGDGVVEPPAGFAVSYDGNGDGIADATQANVTSLLPAAGTQPVTIAAPAGTTLTGVTAGSVPGSPTPPSGATFPVGLLGFTVQLGSGQPTADVEIFLPSGSNPTGYYKLLSGSWVDFASHASIVGDKVTLHLVDNDAFDTNPAPGVIGDPGGPVVVVDHTPPVVTGVPDRAPDVNGWYRAPVTISWTVADPAPSSGIAVTPAPFVVGPEGINIYVSDPAVDNAGNSATGQLTLRIDSIGPTVTCPAAPTFTPNQAGASLTATVTDGTSGPEAASVAAPVPTAVVGPGAVAVTGRDIAGNATTVSCPFVVSATTDYRIVGFSWPVNNAKINVVKAGKYVPLAWLVTDARGRPVTSSSTFVSLTTRNVACPALPQDGIELYSVAMSPTHLGAGIWLASWKAPKPAPSGCVELKLLIAGGATRTVVFKVT